MSQDPDTDNSGDTAAAPPPPFVLAELSDRCMGSAAVATLVLDKLEKQLVDDIREIERLVGVRDSEQIGRTAHALKGAAGAAAAPALRDLAAKIETLARQDRLGAIAEEMPALHAEVMRCLACLPAAREGLQGAKPGGPPGTGAGP